MNNLQTVASKNPGASLLFYGGVSSCSTGVYVIINRDLTGVYYRDKIFEAFVHPYAGVVAHAIVLMGANARSHQACVVKIDNDPLYIVYIEYIECERNITYGLACPSPDVNSIEHVWDILQQQISA